MKDEQEELAPRSSTAMQDQLRNQHQPDLDFGDEVLYAFDYLPENHRLNKEIFARAIERARIKKLRKA